MPRKHAYIVTYVAADGSVNTETLFGCSHVEIERRIMAAGGNVTSLDRDDELGYVKVHSAKRSLGCLLAVVVPVVLAIAVYWYRMR